MEKRGNEWKLLKSAKISSTDIKIVDVLMDIVAAKNYYFISSVIDGLNFINCQSIV